MATEDDKIDTGALATVVAVGAAGMIGISLAVNALVRHEVGSVSAGRDEVASNAYRALKKQQLEKLSAPAAWADQSKGQVSMPIERAMQVVLSDLKRNPWNATPAPPPDAGADAAAEGSPDAGADAATAPQSDAGTAPAPAPSAPGSTGTPPAPAGSATTAAPTAPRVMPPPTVPAPAPPPASAPAQPVAPQPPATQP
jgi:hypothetical protein